MEYIVELVSNQLILRVLVNNINKVRVIIQVVSHIWATHKKFKVKVMPSIVEILIKSYRASVLLLFHGFLETTHATKPKRSI